MSGPERGNDTLEEAPFACLLAICITVIGCIVLFFQAPALVAFLNEGLNL